MWIWLTNEVESAFIQKCLYSFIDMQMYNIDQIDQTGNFVYEELYESNLTDTYMPKVIMEVLPPSKLHKDKNKILHTLSKALPQRCQIRNLKDIIINYVNEDDVFFNFLLQVIKQSLFGTYAHCKERLNFQGRHVLYKSFKTQLIVKPFFIKWFKNGSDHQVLIFFCLKEFLVDTVRQINPIFEIVDKMYGWSRFDTQVCNFMDKIRNMLNTIAVREYNFLNKSDWITSVESILVNAAKQHIKLFRTTPQLTYYSKIYNSLTKYFTEKGMFITYDIIPRELTHFLWNIMIRLHNKKNIFKVLHLFDIEENVMNLLINEKFGPEHYAKQNDRCLKIIIELCRVVELRKSTGLYVLPDHLFKKQQEALKTRENLDCLSKTDKKILGLNYVCMICHDIKMFLMKANGTSSRHSNKLAKGSLRIIVNNCNKDDKLEYVCGRRTERHQRHGKRKWRDDSKIAERKLVKEKQREAISQRCINSPLQEVDMLGHCLLFFNKIMHICTNCGNTCVLNNTCFNYSTNLNCSLCIKSNKKCCEKCSNNIICNEILALDTKIGRFRIAFLCQNCTTIYAQVQPIVI